MPQPSLRRLPGDPSPREIRQAARSIRASWSRRDHYVRSDGWDRQGLKPDHEDFRAVYYGSPQSLGSVDGDGW